MNDRINVISAQIEAIKRKRNHILEMENLLFKYNIDKNLITFEELLKVSVIDFNTLMELMEEENVQSLSEKFQNCNNIIMLYNDLLGELEEIPEATQYDEAISWLDQIGRVLTQHISTYSLNQGNNINVFEKTKRLTLEYINHFKGEQLIKEILNTREFDDLLDKNGLDLPTKVAIKKEIGQRNYDLNFPKEKQKVDYASKYRLVYEKKSQVYQEIIEIVLNFCQKNEVVLKIDTALEQINQINSIITDHSYEQIQNAVATILLKETLVTYDSMLKNNEENLEKIKNKLIDDCEKLLIISRKHPPKEEIRNSSGDFSDKIIDNAKEMISRAKTIIEQERDVLEQNNYSNIDDYYQKFSFETADEEQTLVIIIESIKQSAELLENFIDNYKETPDMYKKNCQEQILNISEYIETYEILKKRINETKENKFSKKMNLTK